jgi:hypothetical protein
MREVLQLFSCSDIRRSAPGLCAGLSNIPLILRLLELRPIPDSAFENPLTEPRKALLLNIEYSDDRSRISLQGTRDRSQPEQLELRNTQNAGIGHYDHRIHAG